MSPDPKFKRILVTSTPGSDWDESNGKTFAECFKERVWSGFKVPVEMLSVRTLIHSFAKDERISLNPNLIQRSSEEKIRLLRRLAFQEIEKRLIHPPAADSTIFVIQTRATSYSDLGKEESLFRRYLEAIRPDLCVVVIDDPILIYQRIPKRDETKKYADFNLTDLVRWMENEVMAMEELACDLNCRLFVIPRLQVGALVELVMSDKKPAYASYAMSYATEQGNQQIRKFVDKLRTYFVVFDPVCMGTAHAGKNMTDADQNAYRDNVKKRDERWLIGINSEYTIVYLPELTPAHGSQKELDTASELTTKIVWVVLEPGYSDKEGRLTPFIDRSSDLVFVSSEEFEHFLGLDPAEQAVYGAITKVMWGFKRRGQFYFSSEKHPKSTNPKLSSSDPQAAFIQGVNKECEEQMERTTLPFLDSEKVVELAQASWKFNLPVLQSKTVDGQIGLFPSHEQEKLAARADALKVPQTDELPVMGPPVSHDSTFTDEEVFLMIFEKHARGKNKQQWFDNIHGFLAQNDLGDFERNARFLRFLRRVLTTHNYTRPSAFTPGNLAQWYREYSSGAEDGSKR